MTKNSKCWFYIADLSNQFINSRMLLIWIFFLCFCPRFMLCFEITGTSDSTASSYIKITSTITVHVYDNNGELQMISPIPDKLTDQVPPYYYRVPLRSEYIPFCRSNSLADLCSQGQNVNIESLAIFIILVLYMIIFLISFVLVV